MKSHLSALVIVAGCAMAIPISVHAAGEEGSTRSPGSAFDLGRWKITLPVDGDGDGRVDEISVSELESYSHPDFFYLDEDGRMVFAAPNRAATTSGSSNTRSELRQMLRGANTRIGTHDPQNNFAVEGRRQSDEFGSVGGRLEATLRVDHVAKNARFTDRNPAYSVVVGQIHAVGHDDTTSGFGYGNEPIKIYYKKWPDHDTGSVFWTYERNLPRDDENRTDIPVPVFGNLWDNSEDPGERGIALGEEFSYEINVHRNTMYVTFRSERLGTVGHAVSLVQGVDELDSPLGYGGDTLYFKAGAYNQCSVRAAEGFWYPGCAGTGDWETDRANGDYAQVSFSRLVQGPSVPFSAADEN